ncbi:MAG: hypothetical protein NTX84_07820, partial [Nitrospirae bacterium]|nr:hypothetical protein [Nitrospirota bacterium]
TTPFAGGNGGFSETALPLHTVKATTQKTAPTKPVTARRRVNHARAVCSWMRRNPNAIRRLAKS